MMKTKSTMSILLALALIAPALFGQGADDQGKGWKHNHDHEAMLANLAPEERQKVQAAHQQAMQDPVVQAAHEKLKEARKQFRDSMHAAMVKADPTVEPILAKLPKHEHDEHPGD
jgi:hypothetical protein